MTIHRRLDVTLNRAVAQDRSEPVLKDYREAAR
jgi:hypothetical protein